MNGWQHSSQFRWYGPSAISRYKLTWHKRSRPRFAREVWDPSEIPGFDEFDADQFRTEFLDGIPSLSRKLFPHLSDKSIALFVSDRMNPCWISDHPVARSNSLNPGDGIRGTLGVANTDVEIYLPIGSRLVLGFLCTSVEEYFRNARRLFSSRSRNAEWDLCR